LLFLSVVSFVTLLPAGGEVKSPSQLPFVFEPNVGQFSANVKYGARNADQVVMLGGDGAEIFVRGSDRPLRFSLAGANRNPGIEGLSLRRSTTNYLLGNRPENFRTGVPQFDRVRYQSVYPGVDLVYYGAGRQLEFDFVVAPGADPRKIRMKFSGAGPVRLNKSGDLVLRAGNAELRQAPPVIYQELKNERVPVEGRYVKLSATEVGFALGDYDRTRPLIIDPILYSTYVGGDNAETATAVATDGLGRVWMTGFTWSQGISAGENVYRDAIFGRQDVFVARLDPTSSGELSLVLLTYIGGSEDDEASAIAIDANNQVYIAGSTTSTDFSLAGNSPQTSNGGERDAFVAKINPTESGSAFLAYSTYIGGASLDVATGVAVDPSGAIYVAGYTTSDNLPGTSAGLQPANRGGWDGFLVKLDPSSSSGEGLRYATYLGSGSTDMASAIAVDQNGVAYVAGNTFSWDFPTTPNSWRQGGIGGGDVFLARIETSRPSLDALTYATYFGGTDYDVVSSMVIDQQGRVVLAGYTLSTDFPLAGSAYQRSNAGETDIFVARFDFSQPVTQSLTYSSYLGGSGTDVAYGLELDSEGRVLLAGYTMSTNFPVTPGASQPGFGGAIDAFVTVMDLEDGPVYSSYLGGAGMDVGYGVATDAQDRTIVAGTTSTRSFPLVGSAWKYYAEGLSEAFLTVFRTSPAP
jgi:hypothetical protein